ncbi:MAG TPA: protein kinase [Polyangiaceae bacterium]|nr:protein kinase [Polyangiaceae bacterium]
MSGEGARDTVALAPQGHTGEAVYQSLVPGQVLAGKYRIERALGKGGMGVVVAAEHIDLHERVALKLMRPGALESDEATARFLREARAAVKIKSEHVARVLDVGKLETGEPYIVMEYLEGTDLGALLDKNGPLPIKQAVEYLLQACEALAEAHGLGIIHRDLKPANLFLARRPDGSALVKLLDFGISKILPRRSSQDPVDLSATNTKQILGTPLYMPPEQLDSSRNADMTSDIWSLGAILFELLTGAVPFDADTLPELRRRIRTEPAPALRQRRKDAPRGLEMIVQRCLEKDPTKRYPNVAELAAALSDYAPARARVAVQRIHRMIENAGLGDTTPQEPSSIDPTPTTGWLGESRSWSRIPRWSNAAGLVTVVLVFGITIASLVFLLRPSRKPAILESLLAVESAAPSALPTETPPPGPLPPTALSAAGSAPRPPEEGIAPSASARASAPYPGAAPRSPSKPRATPEPSAPSAEPSVTPKASASAAKRPGIY